VKRTSRFAALDASIGRKVGLQGSPREGPESAKAAIPNASKKLASLANFGRAVKRRVLMTARPIVSPQDLKHGSEHKFSGPRRERAVDHFGVKTA
jgi:hypothetical protein